MILENTMYDNHIKDMFNDCSVGKLLGIEVSDVTEGFARGKLHVKKDYLNVFGSLHGGILFAFADHIGGACGNSLGRRALLVESTVQFMKPVLREGAIYAEASLTHKGKRIGRIDIRVCTEQGDVVSLMHMVFFMTDHEHPGAA